MNIGDWILDTMHTNTICPDLTIGVSESCDCVGHLVGGCDWCCSASLPLSHSVDLTPGASAAVLHTPE